MIEPRNVPCCQLNASVTSGTTVARRPPKSIAEIGTPLGSSHSGAITGHCLAGAVKRELGCAALRPLPGAQGRRSQSVSSSGSSSVICSQQTSPLGVMAQLVKIEFFVKVSMALAFELMLV